MATSHHPGLDLFFKENWYVGGVSEKRAEDLLAATLDQGNFLVRDSLLPDADYVLSVRVGNEVWHYDICVKPGKQECILYKYSFPDLPAAIAFYSVNRLGSVYLKSPSKPLVSDVQPALEYKIKMASTVSPPRRTLVASESLCAACNGPQCLDKTESPTSPKHLHLSSEHYDCNTSSISASSVDQDSETYHISTAADSTVTGDLPGNSRPDDGTTSNEVVLESYHSLDVDGATTDPASSNKDADQVVPAGMSYSPAELFSSIVQNHSNQLSVLETVAEGSSGSQSDSNNETNLKDEDNVHSRQTDGSQEVADISKSTEGGPGEKESHPSNVGKDGSTCEDDLVKNMNVPFPEEIDPLNHDGCNDEPNRTGLGKAQTGNSVGQLASSLQTLLPASSFSARRPRFSSRHAAPPMCPEGIQITQGPVPIMVGTSGPSPPGAPAIRPVKPRSISSDDMYLVAGPINTKRSGKKLKRHKSMLERGDK